MSSERGFAKLAKEDPERMHDIASKGGKASGEARRSDARDDVSDTSSKDSGSGEHSGERYFTRLQHEDPDKLREIAAKGGKHSHSHE